MIGCNFHPFPLHSGHSLVLQAYTNNFPIHVQQFSYFCESQKTGLNHKIILNMQYFLEFDF